jgi:hypothetical protein
MQDRFGCRVRASLPGPSRRITVEPVEVPVFAPREEPAVAPPPPERDPAPVREPAPAR